MSVSWNSIFNQTAHLLGAIKGATVATAEANYVATLAEATVIGPDYTPSPIKDAAASVLAEIVEAISETPLHPEWADFRQLTGALASGALIPASVGGTPRIGRIGDVLDSVDAEPLKRATYDEVISYSRFSATIYAQSQQYKFAERAGCIYHTRANVTVALFCFQRPTLFSGDIPIRDTHEQPLVCGAVRRLAPKESMYTELGQQVDKIYTDHLAAIRALGDPQAFTEMATAPATI